ncbi:MAG: hypothetical protein IJW72_01540 [Alphaproteobacteria bacterium]|nr:hypothetical protein [Alphaproteobacteria bacterium]
MNNNPLAVAIRNAFIKNVLEKPFVENKEEAAQNTIKNILKNKRICLFEQAINRFLIASGQPPVQMSSQFADEKNLLTFSLQLSGYIRDAQKALDKLSSIHACNPALINLYRAAAKYSADCSGQIKDSKYVFREHCDYQFWKINNHDTLSNAQFINDNLHIDPKRRNLIVSMPFHIQGSQEELQKWSSKFLNDTLDNKNVFGSQVDVYLAHFPIEQPRGEKFALSLETIRNPQTYFEDVDMRFVQKYLLHFIGKDIRLDKQNRIISGTPYNAEVFKKNCQLTFLDYCAGGAHVHRWINAFSHIASQLYDRNTTNDALKNMFVISYAFLPIQKESKYSGAHFMSSFADDKMRKEPFIKMFNPELYEQSKYHHNTNAPAKITIMPDNRNYIIALNLPEDFAVYDEHNQKQALPDLENGHHMAVITRRNANSITNYPYKQFITVLENASIGYRGLNVFNKRPQGQICHPMETMAVFTLHGQQKQISPL